MNITQPFHLARGDTASGSQFDISAHTDTRVDVPAHIIPGGSGVDTLDLSVVGPALVVEAMKADTLSADLLQGLPILPDTERVLFRIRNSDRWARGEREFSKENTR